MENRQKPEFLKICERFELSKSICIGIFASWIALYVLGLQIYIHIDILQYIYGYVYGIQIMEGRETSEPPQQFSQQSRTRSDWQIDRQIDIVDDRRESLDVSLTFIDEADCPISLLRKQCHRGRVYAIQTPPDILGTSFC